MGKIYNLEKTFRYMWDNPPSPDAKYQIAETDPPQYRKMNPSYDPNAKWYADGVPKYRVHSLPVYDHNGVDMKLKYENLGLIVEAESDVQYACYSRDDEDWSRDVERTGHMEGILTLKKRGTPVIVQHWKGWKLVSLEVK